MGPIKNITLNTFPKMFHNVTQKCICQKLINIRESMTVACNILLIILNIISQTLEKVFLGI